MMSGTSSNFASPEKKPSGNELLRLLECPICSETLLPPIFNCTNGHSICNDCRINITKCAICNGPLTNIRCITLESIVSNTLFKCRFLTEGCNKLINGDLLREHHENCNYRNIICEETKTTHCIRAHIPYKDYLKHLEQTHNCYFAKSTSEDFHIEQSLGEIQLHTTDTKWPPVVKKIVKNGEEKIFFFQTEIQNGLICWWLSAFDPQDESRTFSFTLYRKESMIPKIECQSRIFPFRNKYEDIKDLICFKLPVDCLLKFANFKGTTCEEKRMTWNVIGSIKEKQVLV